jgi:hypothetical protein
MAKRLLLNLLVKVLGEFIELNEENLNLGVWSGQIILNNLKLKTDKFLRNLNVVINHGSIKTLEIKIPWATLLQNPIRIKITGVYLDVGPLDLSTLNKEEEFKRILEEKLRKLKVVEKYLELSSSIGQTADNNAGSGSESYMQQWSSKIIDNIEIVLQDVHFRYEDSVSVPGRIMAAGLTLESFEISTCDENWQPTAFSSTKGDKTSASTSTAVNKLATVKSLGIYWQVGESVSISKQTPDAWEASMQSLIYKLNTGAQPPPQLQYILSPYKNSLFLRLTHNKKQTSLLPRFDVLAESSNLQLDVDSEQYRQLFSVMDRMNAIERTQLPFSYCPLDRPTENAAAARAWWKYAVKLVLARPRYIRLVKLSRVAEEDATLASIFTAKDAAQKKHYEERLSFATLKMYRQIAILEMTDDSRKKLLQAQAGLKHGVVPTSPTKHKPSHAAPSAPSPKQSSGGWFGWLAGSGGGGDSVYDEEEDEEEGQSNENSPDPKHKHDSRDHLSSESSSSHGPSVLSTTEDISIESIISSLNRQEETLKTASVNAIYLRFSINSSSVISLHSNHVPIVRCNSTVAFSFTQASSGLSLACELKDFLLADRYTLNPPVPNIISVKQVLVDKQHRAHHTATSREQGNKPTLSVLFENKGGKSKVVISALPIEVSLNRVCISKLLSEFGRPENRYAVAKKPHEPRRRTASLHVGDFSYRGGESPFSAGSSGDRKKGPSSSILAQQTLVTQQSISNLTFGSMVPSAPTDGDLEIVFEAYAPKIILPEDSTADKGYLLLDAGYLAVSGSFGAEGFKVSVSLRAINAGLPQSTRDMYSFGDKALYLIKVRLLYYMMFA